MMRSLGLAALLLLCGCVPPNGGQPTGAVVSGSQFQFGDLQQAIRNYPPLIMGYNVHDSTGTPPRSCPRAGSRVEQKGGPAFEYLGASTANPDLCRVRIGPDTANAWFGIWLTDWPGADAAYPALKRLFAAQTGAIEAFDVRMGVGREYHDLMRNEGIEDISLLGHTYRAMKVSHYREGFNRNFYRSVSTVWKDMDSGMLIYGTYQHISGAPEIDDPIIPTRIVP
jgi:hypothetical protein